MAERSTDKALENITTSDAGIDSGYGDAAGLTGLGDPTMAGGVGAYADASVAVISDALVQAGLEVTEATISMARSGGTLAELANVGSSTIGGGGGMGAELGANASGASTLSPMATAGTALGGALGGYAGGWIADQIIPDQPQVQMVGTVLGTYAGAYAGAAAMGASTAVVGTGAAATSAAGAAAGAVAGPLAIAAAVYVIGTGIVGAYEHGRRREETRDRQMQQFGEFWADTLGGATGGLVDDPTGG